MIVSVGILAWNEEKNIANTLDSLFQQSIFLHEKDDLGVSLWEIIVVPNGCNDKTAAIANDSLCNFCKNYFKKEKITWNVVEISQAGKSNAWNRYIHDFSKSNSEIIVMIDADIIFDNIDTIYNSIKEIIRNPEADVVVDQPLKHFAKKEEKTLREWVSTVKSEESCQGEPGIAGSFYCGRGNVLREIWMPPGLTAEDGFLRAMIITDLFRSPPDPRRIIRVTNASHFYEGLTDLKAIFRHELRMVIGTTLNCYFCWDFLAYATDPKGNGAGELIKNRIENDPAWYEKFIKNEIKNRRWWVLPRKMLFRKIINLKSAFWSGRPRHFLVAFIGLLLDIPIMVVANYKLKRGIVGYW